MSGLQTVCCLVETSAGQMEVEGTKIQICQCALDCGLGPRCQKEDDGMLGISLVVLLSKPTPSAHHWFSGCILWYQQKKLTLCYTGKFL